MWKVAALRAQNKGYRTPKEKIVASAGPQEAETQHVVASAVVSKSVSVIVLSVSS